MGIFSAFYPERCVSTAYEVDYEGLWKAGIRALIYDVDNTLVPHGAPADERAKALFERLHRIGFSVILLSNNKEPRVQSFARQVTGADYIFQAKKPSLRGYREAMERMGSDITNTMFIGDQLFTDIWGAKRVGMHNILVSPIHPKEEIQIVWKRKLERIVLWFYRRSQS